MGPRPPEMRTPLRIGQIRMSLLTITRATATRMTTETIRLAAGSARHRSAHLNNIIICYPVVLHSFPDEEYNAQVYLRIGMSYSDITRHKIIRYYFLYVTAIGIHTVTL